MNNDFHRVQANINLDAIRQNILNGKKLLKPGTKMMVVVKADAYGHGAFNIVKNVDDISDAYAVAIPEEGVELRKKGATKKPILVLGYTFPELCEEAILNDIALAAFDFETVKSYDEVAAKLNKNAVIHLKLDTGMSRIGYQCDTEEQIEKSLEDIKKIYALKHVIVEGMFTHFCKADEPDKTFARGQLAKYLRFAEILKNNGIEIPIKHVCNSAGVIDIPEGDLDMVRFGITTYGMYPTDDVTKERCPVVPAMELKTRISMVKVLPAGTGIGYSGTYVCKEDRRIATIPVGYGDGFPRGLSNAGRVLINGKTAPIRGRICMDQCMVDVTDIPEAHVGSVVTLIGRDGDEFISAEEIGATVGNSFHYEVVCDVAKRVPRVYYRDGKVIAVQDNFKD
ncbi:MAG: alanine racemase [Lachnospiraceae bacterium]|nr:alanine racemase [Lachnospiraceae bacterium]